MANKFVVTIDNGADREVVHMTSEEFDELIEMDVRGELEEGLEIHGTEVGELNFSTAEDIKRRFPLDK